MAPTITIDSPRAWVATVAASLANGMAFGTAYTFGTFFESMADEFDAERGSTALLFGITLLFFFGFGIVSGPLSDRFGRDRFLAVGGTLFVAGLLLTSRVSSVGLGYITYGIGVGIGAGCFVAPLTAHVGQLFVRQRALALGVVATGNGLGTLILSPLSERLIEAHGWRSGYQILAIVAGVIFLLALPAVRGRPATDGDLVVDVSTGEDSPVELGFLRTPAFRSLFVSGTLMSIGLFVAFAFVVPFATDEGVSSSAASRLVAIIGLASIIGRLGLTSSTRRHGSVVVYQAALAIQPVAFVIWLFAGGTYPLLVAFAVILGVSYGGFVAVAPAVLIDVFGAEQLGRKMGAVFFSFGLGGLVGPTAAGYVSYATSGRSAPILLVLAILVIALVTTMPLRQVSIRPTTAS